MVWHFMEFSFSLCSWTSGLSQLKKNDNFEILVDASVSETAHLQQRLRGLSNGGAGAGVGGVNNNGVHNNNNSSGSSQSNGADLTLRRLVTGNQEMKQHLHSKRKSLLMAINLYQLKDIH